MANGSFNIPENLFINTFDVSVYLAAKLYEDGIISSGNAAKIAGLSKRAFIEIMGKYGVSNFSSTLSELNNDILNA
jgi:predicted HTH domain antitoxin